EVLKIDPDNLAYKRSLADSMNTFGAWFNGEGRRQEAVAQFREAAHFYRELVEKAPTDPNLLNELVRQLSNLGDMLQLMLDYAGAERELRDAAAAAARLVKHAPEEPEYQFQAAVVGVALGELEMRRLQSKAAEEQLTAARSALRRLVRGY